MRGPLQLYGPNGLPLNTSQSWPAASRSSKLFDGLRDRGGTATEQDTADLSVLRQRSAALLRQGGIGQALVQTMTAGVVGTGLEVLPEVDHTRLGISEQQGDEVEDWLRAEWSMYSVGLNYSTPAQSFPEFVTDILRECLEFGDCLVVKVTEPGRSPYTTRAQLVEAVRLANKDKEPDTVQHHSGISFDTAGRPVSYDVANGDPAWTGVVEWTTVQAEHAVLCKLPGQRLGGSRGIPWLAPVLGAIHSLGEYSSNEVLASWIQNLYALVHKSDSYHEAGYAQDAIEPGSIFQLGRDEDLSSIDSNKPARQFSDFFFSQFKVICASTGLPFEVVVKHFQSSYSASRGAILTAEATFRVYRQWLISTITTPLYVRFLMEALRLGRVPYQRPNWGEPGVFEALSRSEWLGQSPAALDLNRLGQGVRAFDELGLLSKRRITREYLGTDYKRMQREIAMERTGEPDAV